MPNRLAQETSPYLLQHQDNPVDWYPWGDEAIERAKAEDKPIFLSIGYSACHWCHVMEHESFENDKIAEMLNAEMVPIKVDREERPDLDQVYMHAVQLMTGRGGWPMSVFLTPDLKPFYGGTYWPPSGRMGMPGFDQIITAVADAWKNRRDDAVESARRLTEQISQVGAAGEPADKLGLEMLDHAAHALHRGFDSQYGGFGQAPKFPHAMDLGVLLRCWSRSGSQQPLDMVRLTLDRMAAGGIYDHLGGGFARYSVDARWLVPHFEKMLYDNALLAGIYLDAYRATGEPRYGQVVRETLDYILRDMTDPAGGFYSTEDADSEGEEGKFYVWTPGELEAVLGEEAAATFARVYDVSEAGNFEGKNILNLPKSIEQCTKLLERDEAELREELADSRAKLLAARNKRVRPGLDDKVLTSWNGLMIDSLARSAGVLREPKYLEAAQQAAKFVLTEMTDSDGRLLHTWRDGTAKLAGYLDDYAALVNALVSLYEADFDAQHLEDAARLADVLLESFRDADGGGFFFTGAEHETLLARPKSLQDGSEPSGNALAATGLLRLGLLTGRTDLVDVASETIRAGSGLMQAAPSAAGQMLIALDLLLGPTYEFVLVADADTPTPGEVLAHFRRAFLPRSVVALRDTAATEPTAPVLEPLLAGKDAQQDGALRLFVCQNFACQAPAEGKEAILAEIDRLVRTK